MKKIIILLILIFPMSTMACSLAINIFRPNFNMEAFSYDVPPVFEFSIVRIIRGQGPEPAENGMQVSSSCDDIGFIEISIESKDKHDPCEYGYYIYDKTGTAPKGLIPRYPQKPMHYKGQCILSLSWMDGASWVQEVLDFELQFEAVNNYLYKSDRSESLPVVWFGREDE
ncbi:MAG: hypothetical protein DWP95_12235 [Proteobacteria bacterium]|nr:MAG: hypothetical protein DWP95_12235 [Pseudomonadota bacterium]